MNSLWNYSDSLIHHEFPFLSIYEHILMMFLFEMATRNNSFRLYMKCMLSIWRVACGIIFTHRYSKGEKNNHKKILNLNLSLILIFLFSFSVKYANNFIYYQPNHFVFIVNFIAWF